MAPDVTKPPQDIHELSEQLRLRSEDLRAYSMGLVFEAREILRASRQLRRTNAFLAYINPAPDAANKRKRGLGGGETIRQ